MMLWGGRFLGLGLGMDDWEKRVSGRMRREMSDEIQCWTNEMFVIWCAGLLGCDEFEKRTDV